MPWTALVCFTCAIATWRFTLQHPDDVGRFLGGLATLFLGLAGLITAPLLLQGAALAGVLVSPICSPATPDRSRQGHCPRLCLLQHQCPPPGP